MREILTFPDPRLREKSKSVAEVTDKIRSIMDEMLEVMYEAPGIGLAAPQVNIHKRIVVMDLSEEKDSPLFFINPEIITSSGTEEMEEGCLSVPDYTAIIERPSEVTVKALNRNGDEFELKCDDLLAVCIQHEIDHLDGKLFVDYLSPLKRQMVRKKLEKLKKSQK